MRKYKENECLVFRDGPLSNLYTGYPIQIGILTAFSSESLYQAAKFPHLHDVQREILRGDISQNPGTISERYRPQYREDWTGIRVQVMRWVLRAKLYNSEAFKYEILSTEDLQIVLSTRKDGAAAARQDGRSCRAPCGVCDLDARRHHVAAAALHAGLVPADSRARLQLQGAPQRVGRLHGWRPHAAPWHGAWGLVGGNPCP